MTTLRGHFDPRQLRSTIQPSRVGQRVVLIDVDERLGRSRYVRNYRAVSDVITDEAGHNVIAVVADADWPTCRGACAATSDDCPHRQSWPAELVWAE